MKNLSTCAVTIITTLLFLIPCHVKAWNNSRTYSIQLDKYCNSEFNDDIDPDVTGHRAPARPIFGTISQDTGINIPNIELEEIVSYEIYDENQNCIASFPDETDFITYLFSCSGEIEIRLNLTDYSLVGFLIL